MRRVIRGAIIAISVPFLIVAGCLAAIGIGVATMADFDQLYGDDEDFFDDDDWDELFGGDIVDDDDDDDDPMVMLVEFDDC